MENQEHRVSSACSPTRYCVFWIIFSQDIVDLIEYIGYTLGYAAQDIVLHTPYVIQLLPNTGRSRMWKELEICIR